MEFRPFAVELTTTFRGVSRRTGVLMRGTDAHGADHWGEYSPFADYDPERAGRWWRAAAEAARGDWPPTVRTSVAVNSIVPEVSPERARQFATAHGARTAKVKVGGRDSLAADAARVEAVADALGATGRVRIDVNGAWEPEDAVRAIRTLDAAARSGGVDGLEYVEQPCERVEDLAWVRRHVDVRVAADEAVRIPGNADAVLATAAADVIILKVAPLGGVRRCLEIAAQVAPLPVVVAGSLESSVGLAAGIHLACALPAEPLACGLGTGALLATDTVRDTVLPRDGRIGPTLLEVTA